MDNTNSENATPEPAKKQCMKSKMMGLCNTVCGTFSFLPPLATRIFIGLAFYQAGSGKLANIDRPIGFFTSLGIPFPTANAYFIANLECFGGILLVLGLGTRFFSALLSCTMIVALATAHRGDIQALIDAMKVTDPEKHKSFIDVLTGMLDITAFQYLLLLSWLPFYGAGAVSLDRLIRKFTGCCAPCNSCGK